MAPEKSTIGNKPENYEFISNLIALEEKKSTQAYRRMEARRTALWDNTKGFLALLSMGIVFFWLFGVTPRFLVTVGNLFSTDLSFREYMEFKPHVDPGYHDFHELFTNWEIVMLWFFCLFIVCFGYKMWMAISRRDDKRLDEKNNRWGRLWKELDTWNKKALLDLAKEKELSPPLNMRSKKFDIMHELLRGIK